MFYSTMNGVNNQANIAPNIGATSAKPASASKFKLFYVNDLHGQTDNLGGVLGASMQFDSSTKGANFDTLKISGGDNWAGGNDKKNQLMAKLLNFMKFDATTVGNHEFDGGVQAFKDIAGKSKHTKFLSSNINLSANNIAKSTVIEENGNKYGVIGLTPVDLKSVQKSERIAGIEVENFDNTVLSTQKEIDALKTQGINKIIITSHLGDEFDKKLAASLDGADIIVGGHSHAVLDGAIEGKNLLVSKSGEPVITLSAGENAKYFGLLEGEFDANGILTKISNKIHEANTSKNSVIDSIRDSEIGKSPQLGTIDKIVPLAANRRIAPSPWTALMADSMRDALGVEVAIINSSNTRKVPQSGILTVRDVEESTPMKNKLLKTELSEKQICDAIKNSCKVSLGSSDGYPGLLQGSGFKYEVDSNGNLLKLVITDKNGVENNVNINNPSADKFYSASIDNFLQKGTEYPELVPTKPVQTFEFDKDKTLVDFIQKMPNKNNLVIEDDGRLKIIQTSARPQQSNNTRNI